MPYTISHYIIERLQQCNVDVLFGVPAVYCAALYSAAQDVPNFRTIVTNSDLEAGYAADGYARCRGLSVVSVAYGVGTLSLVNAIAGAYIERSPVVVINGGPSNESVEHQTKTGILFSHSMGRPHSDLETFKPFTVFCERVSAQADIPRLVDAALKAALTRKHPVYLEINQAWLGAPAQRPTRPLDLSVAPGTAVTAAQTIGTQIRAAQHPLLIVGVEIERYSLQTSLQAIIDKFQLRWVTTLLAKSVLPERAEQGFVGVFSGDKAAQSVVDAVKQADLIVALGAVFGSGHARLMNQRLDRTIQAWDGQVTMRAGPPQRASIAALVTALAAAPLTEIAATAPVSPAASLHLLGDDTLGQHEYAVDGDRSSPPRVAEGQVAVANPTPVPNGLNYSDIFQAVGDASFFDASMAAIVDTCLGIYPAASLRMPGPRCFVSGCIWASIGHSVGAAVGVAAAGDKRPVVICGDGGFHMTAPALSTMVHEKQNAIIVLVDNGLHGYEQYLLDSTYYRSTTRPPVPFAVLSRWDYTAFATALGVERVAKVDTLASLRTALQQAKALADGPAFIHAVVRSRSLPSPLE